MKPNIYKFGELITDVTTHTATRRTLESHSRSFDAARDPEGAERFIGEDPFVTFGPMEGVKSCQGAWGAGGTSLYITRAAADPALAYLGPIRAAADSAASLTRQLLAFARRQLIQP